MVRPITPEKCSWLPPTCAYRLVANGEPLPSWHPLISGDRHSVHDEGMSVKFWALSETEVALEEYQQHIIEFEND